MGRYAATGAQATNGSSYKTALGITGGTTRRPKLEYFAIGFGGTPADNMIAFALRRSTAAGTSTAVTPAPLDAADPASVAAAGENHTVEPTYTAGSEMFEQIINQRATFSWMAAPGSEIVIPATAANGLGIAAKHASYASSVEATFHFNE